MGACCFSLCCGGLGGIVSANKEARNSAYLLPQGCNANYDDEGIDRDTVECGGQSDS